MYGKAVIIRLKDDISVPIFVFCTPDTTERELYKRALILLQRNLTDEIAKQFLD